MHRVLIIMQINLVCCRTLGRIVAVSKPHMFTTAEYLVGITTHHRVQAVKCSLHKSASWELEGRRRFRLWFGDAIPSLSAKLIGS